MKRHVVTAISAVLAMALVGFGTCHAQALKIGFVDFAQFAAKSKKAQAQQKKFAQLVQSKRNKLEKMKQELIQMQEQLQKQGPMLKDDTRTARIKEIGIKEMELKLAEKEAENVLRNEQRDTQEVFQRDVIKLIAAIRKQKGLTMVINASALLSVDDSLNITDEVIRAYDAQAVTSPPKPKSPSRKARPAAPRKPK